MCAKCVSKGLECSGLGIRHRFNDGMAARGKWVGKTVQAVHAKSSCTHDSSGSLRYMVNSEAGPLKYADAPWTEHSCAVQTTPPNTRFQALSSTSVLNSGNDDDEQSETSEHEAIGTPTEDQQSDPLPVDLAILQTTSPGEVTNKSGLFPGELNSSGLSANNSRDPSSAILRQPVLASMPLWKKVLLLNCKLNPQDASWTFPF